MREIKFRAWIHKDNKYITGKQATCVAHFTNSFNYRKEEYTLEQYTGLKDFYEGDYFREKGYNSIYLIEFKDGMFCYKILGDYKPLATIMDFIDDIEKCGNIHEGEIIV